jgi:hypothetical protein
VEAAHADQVIATVEGTAHGHVVVRECSEGGVNDGNRKLGRIGADQDGAGVALLVAPAQDVCLPHVPAVAVLRHELAAARGRRRGATDSGQGRGEIGLGRGVRPTDVESEVLFRAGGESRGEVDQESGIQGGGALHADRGAQPRFGETGHGRPGRDEEQVAAGFVTHPEPPIP